MSAPPPGLEELQRALGGLLATPLDPKSGTWSPRPRGDEVGALRALRVRSPRGLEVYQRQRWYRLFEAMQEAFPLTARLVGPFEFNALAQAFLVRCPPRGWDLGQVGDGFVDHLRCLPAEVLGASRELILEAASLEETWRQLWRAPQPPPWRPTLEQVEHLPERRLRLAPNVRLFVERWPLCQLRGELSAYPSEHRLPAPTLLDTPRAWALIQNPEGRGEVALEPLEARLLAELEGACLQDVLDRWELSTPEAERPTLAASVQRWVARAVLTGLWADPADPGPPVGA